MDTFQIFWLCLVLCVIGIIVFIGVIKFGQYIFKHRILPFPLDCHSIKDLDQHFFGRHSYDEFIRLLNVTTKTLPEYYEKRNDFWTLYGQITITLMILLVLTILLLTKSISAEAGLPILSGISGFAIAKGVGRGRTLENNPNRIE